MTHCCFSCTSMKSNKYLEISYATSKYQVLHCCRMQPNDNMICFVSTFAHWSNMYMEQIQYWAAITSALAPFLSSTIFSLSLSFHFQHHLSFHSPFLWYLQFPVLSLSPLFFNFMFFIALFLSIHIFTYAADRDASQGLQLSPSTLSFHFLPFLSFWVDLWWYLSYKYVLWDIWMFFGGWSNSYTDIRQVQQKIVWKLF